MRISRDKLNKLAHVVSDTLAETDEANSSKTATPSARKPARPSKSCSSKRRASTRPPA